MLGQQQIPESPSVVKVLGVLWKPQADQLQFDVTEIVGMARTTEPTKQNVVSIVGRFYDRLKFLAPVIIRLKILFQKLCELQLQWDELLPEAMSRMWKALIDSVQSSCPMSKAGVDVCTVAC